MHQSSIFGTYIRGVFFTKASVNVVIIPYVALFILFHFHANPTSLGLPPKSLLRLGTVDWVIQILMFFKLWPCAFSIAVYLSNHLPFISRQNLSPWTTLFGSHPGYFYFRTFGCTCYPLLRPYNRHKFQPRSAQSVFMGYTTHAKGYLCYNPTSTLFYVSQHVIFYESTFPFRNLTPPSPPVSTSSWLCNLLYFPSESSSILGPYPSVPPMSPIHASNPIDPVVFLSDPTLLFSASDTTPLEPSSTSISPISTSTASTSSHQSTFVPISESIHQSIALPVSLPSTNFLPVSLPTTNTNSMVTRSKAGISKKKQGFAAHSSSPPDYLNNTKPPSYSVACKYPQWRDAMQSEFQALQRQSTWTLVPSSSDHNVIGYQSSSLSEIQMAL
jgi:hypothetical protein